MPCSRLTLLSPQNKCENNLKLKSKQLQLSRKLTPLLLILFYTERTLFTSSVFIFFYFSKTKCWNKTFLFIHAIIFHMMMIYGIFICRGCWLDSLIHSLLHLLLCSRSHSIGSRNYEEWGSAIYLRMRNVSISFTYSYITKIDA